MTTVFIFNPETDYALASFSPSYTPPPKVTEVRRRLALSPLAFASPGDILLLMDPPADGMQDAPRESEGERIIPPDRIRDVMKEIGRTPSGFRFQPWGWNPAVKRWLARNGAPESLLPSEEYLDYLRRLSHRRTTISFNLILNELLAKAGFGDIHQSPIPAELDSVSAVGEWLHCNAPAFLKAPWSSSGRGIFFADGSDNAKALQWSGGIIRKQGAVMAEKAADKAIDFASEWHVSQGKARFLGMSLFEASPRGHYISNFQASDEEIISRVRTQTPDFSLEFIEAQRTALERVAAGYDGFAGIDMLAARDGAVRGCVEINFRMTMGMAALPCHAINLKEILNYE